MINHFVFISFHIFFSQFSQCLLISDSNLDSHDCCSSSNHLRTICFQLSSIGIINCVEMNCQPVGRERGRGSGGGSTSQDPVAGLFLFSSSVDVVGAQWWTQQRKIAWIISYCGECSLSYPDMTCSAQMLGCNGSVYV